MKNRYHWKVPVIILVLAILIPGCVGSPNSTCKNNNDCTIGYLCDNSGACFPGDHITITTLEVTPAIINSSYSFQITHAGGINPLTWSIDTSTSSDYLDWLTIDSATGMLINIQGPPEIFPSTITNAAHFRVSVTDSSDNGTGETISSQLYTMIIRSCNNDFISFKPVQGACMEGTQKCNNGVLGDFEPNNPSDNPNHCGVLSDQCSNCRLLYTDRCVGGTNCYCGSQLGGCNNKNSYCCAEVCTMADDVNNCGGCGVKCNSEEICCDGKCSDTLNDAINCGGCGQQCNDGYACVGGSCECNSDGDCDSQLYCCNHKCITLNTAQNCGFCGIQCAVNETCDGYFPHFCSCKNGGSCPVNSSAIRCSNAGYTNGECYCLSDQPYFCADGEQCCDNGGVYQCCPGGDCNSASCYN